MNITLAAWNAADESAAMEAMLACCGSKRWAQAMVAQRPIASVWALSQAADRVWGTMREPDWLEAFAFHPRIGERQPVLVTTRPSYRGAARSSEWSQQEQSSAKAASELVLAELAADNELYAQRFGFTYIVCATGKSATEMLTILKQRLANDRESELREAAEQQRQIMQIRLGKWLVE
ncbi:MAG: 2-oxo-4-hydroxy-4-carboxy-5-ureidoimidazoline decarboxylase [Terracidiphilus sp.]